MVDDFFDVPEYDGPDHHQLAFAAYEDAWRVRDTTSDPTTRPLVDALNAREVPASMWAPGTPLHRALFDSWDRGRRPHRMHPTILRYRLARLRAGFSEARAFFAGDPEHLRIPADHRRHSTWSGGGDDEVELDLSPVGTLAVRLPGWYAELRDPDDDDEEEVVASVWLDVSASSTPDRTPVMVGSTLIGHTIIPAGAHRALVEARTRRGRRVVADGTIDITPTSSGQLRASGLAISLPAPD